MLREMHKCTNKFICGLMNMYAVILYSVHSESRQQDSMRERDEHLHKYAPCAAVCWGWTVYTLHCSALWGSAPTQPTFTIPTTRVPARVFWWHWSVWDSSGQNSYNSIRMHNAGYVWSCFYSCQKHCKQKNTTSHSLQSLVLYVFVWRNKELESTFEMG